MNTQLKQRPIPAANAVAAASDMFSLRQFIPVAELSAIRDGLRGEESQFFHDKLAEITHTVVTMPETYGQDGLGYDAIAYLHYFSGGNDWYITEKDAGDPDDAVDPGQIQAFGLVSLLGGEPEFGYISIAELIQCGVELDLYFTPKALKELDID